MKKHSSIALLVASLVSMSACGDDTKKTGTSGDTREVTGLSKSSVGLKGYYYVAGLLGYDGSYPDGAKFENAIRQALGEINAQGGVHGHSVGLILCNTSGDPVVTQECLDEVAGIPYINSIIGPMRSIELLGIADSVKQHQIVVMSPSATSPQITPLDDDGFVNRDCASDAFQGKVTAELAKSLGGYTNVFIAAYNDPYGTGLRDVFKSTFESLGGTATAYTFDPAAEDFASQTATAAAAAQPQAIYLAGFLPENVAITNALDNVSFTTPPKFISCDLLYDPTFISQVNNQAKMNGDIGITPSPAVGPIYDNYEANYQKLWGEPDEAYVPNAYDAVYLLSLAMQITDDPDDRVSLRDALAKTHDGTQFNAGDWTSGIAAVAADGQANYNGPSGPVDLDANGEVEVNYTHYTYTNGAITAVDCRTPEGDICP